MQYPEFESSRIEFKKELPKNEQILKTLIGFCNQFGGKLIIGVDDSGKILGISEEVQRKAMEYLEKSVYESCAPPILPQVYTRRFADRTVLVIQVSSGMNKPYYQVSKGLDKGTYIRLGRSTMRANADMIEELKWQSRGRTFDELPLYHASESDLNENALKLYLRSRTLENESIITNDTLLSYKILVEQHGKLYPTNAGLLCFGRDPQHFFSEAFIICSRFKGDSGRDALATLDCSGSLIEQFRQAIDFIVKHLERSSHVKGIVREEQLEIPEAALREVLLNALIHRNYHIPAPTKIAIYDHHLEIFTPGSFPGPLNVNKLTQGITFLRNPIICRFFRELGLIEKLGSGFITLFQSYQNAKLIPPTVIEGENYIKCVLPRKRVHEMINPEKMTENEKIMILVDQVEKLSLKVLIEKFGISRSTAQRRLKDLVRTGSLERIGAGRSVQYRRKK
jgi:ATP-dependent DNA helicase RecG